VQYIHTNPLEFLNHVIVCQNIIPKHMIVAYDVAYDKSVMYGFHKHGGIDGASHYVLWAKVALNPKKKETNFEGYVFVVQKFGPPLWIRLDFAIEHILIKDHIEVARVGIRNLCIISSFTKNQVLYFNTSVNPVHNARI